MAEIEISELANGQSAFLDNSNDAITVGLAKQKCSNVVQSGITESQGDEDQSRANRNRCEINPSVANSVATDTNKSRSSYSESHELTLLLTCAEIGLQIVQLNDSLMASIFEEQSFLQQMNLIKKIRCRPIKCKLLEIGDLVQLFRKYLVNWNNLWIEGNYDALDRSNVNSNSRCNISKVSLTLHLREFVDHLKETLRLNVTTFVQRLDRLYRIGIKILSQQGVLQEVPATAIQKCIAGIADFESLARELGDLLTAATPGGISHPCRTPSSANVNGMLRLIAAERGRRFARVMLDLLDAGVTSLSPDFESVAAHGTWPLVLPPPGHTDSWPPRLAVAPQHRNSFLANHVGGSTSDYCSGDSGGGNERRRRSVSELSKEALSTTENGPNTRNGEASVGAKMTHCCVALQTMYSQEELSVSKLAFVIRLSVSGGVNGCDATDLASRSGTAQLGGLAVGGGRNRTSGQMSRAPLGEPGHDRIYWDELELKTLDHLLSGLDGVFSPRGRSRGVGGCGGGIGALTSGHLVELANVAEELREFLEKEVPLVRVFNSLKSHFHLLAVRKAWDQSFCQLLSAIANPKCTAAFLTNDNCGTNTGKSVTDCLHYIFGIELLASTKPDFTVESIHDTTFPLLLVTLQVTASWLEASIKLALGQWHIGKFGYIAQGDLKKIVDLLKHVESINPAQRSSSVLSALYTVPKLQLLRDRESLCRRLSVWDDVRAAASHLQNNSSTCMKDFCKAGNLKTKTAVETLMPAGKVWQQNCRRKGIPTACNAYARALVEEVMVPVVEGVARLPVPAQIGVVTMATKVFIETWMAHILNKRIRFSLHGAHLLRLDFQHLIDFLRHQPTLSPETRQSVQSLEVIRQLRGAAALLMHQSEPPPHFGLLRVSRRVTPMGDDQTIASADSEETSQADTLDGGDYESAIADEEYVTDRAAWLSLRVRNGQRRSFAPFWCFL